MKRICQDSINFHSPEKADYVTVYGCPECGYIEEDWYCRAHAPQYLETRYCLTCQTRIETLTKQL